jgi:uncharacterized RDD family membrane protein YckC
MSDDFVPRLKPLPEPEYRAPGGGRPELPVAGLWARAMALAVDLALLSAAFYFFAHYAYESLYPARHATQPVAAILLFLYFWIGNGPLAAGQTAGKKLANLRVARRDGGNLTWGQAALRALFVLVLVYAYVSLPLLAPILPWRTFVPPASIISGVAFASLCFIAIGYALSNAVFCGLHPKKASLHDLLAKSMVVHAGRENEAAAFLAECDDVCRTKVKLAKWPAGAMALVFVVMLIYVWSDFLPRFGKEYALQRKIGESLNPAGFEFTYLLRPSREGAQRFDRDLARAQKQRAEQHLSPLTTATLRLLPDGRKMHFSFVCDEIMSSRTLVADPRYGQLLRRLPPLADELSRDFLAASDGTREPYSHVQVEFREELPLFLYARERPVWADLIRPEGGDAATTRTAAAERPKPPAR